MATRLSPMLRVYGLGSLVYFLGPLWAKLYSTDYPAATLVVRKQTGSPVWFAVCAGRGARNDFLATSQDPKQEWSKDGMTQCRLVFISGAMQHYGFFRSTDKKYFGLMRAAAFSSSKYCR